MRPETEKQMQVYVNNLNKQLALATKEARHPDIFLLIFNYWKFTIIMKQIDNSTSNDKAHKIGKRQKAHTVLCFIL